MNNLYTNISWLIYSKYFLSLPREIATLFLNDHINNVYLTVKFTKLSLQEIIFIAFC